MRDNCHRFAFAQTVERELCGNRVRLTLVGRPFRLGEIAGVEHVDRENWMRQEQREMDQRWEVDDFLYAESVERVGFGNS